MRLKKAAKGIVIFVTGPTAIGKTRISIGLAKKIRGEVISCDSMQVYRGMNILSQAPTKEQLKSARHHLIDILSPEKEYSVASFRRRAVTIIRSVIKRGKVPIIVGGGGLYLKALIYGLFPAPPADMKFRARMQRFASRNGSKRLHERLMKIDPDSGMTIHHNDVRRIIRSLEIAHTTGRTMTELKSRTKGLKEHYNVKIFCLTAPRKKIYARIDQRVDTMFSDGAVNEVRRLARKRLSKTAAAVLGFKEINGYLKGEYDIAMAREMMKMNTRRFARRQLTWFRADPGLIRIDTARNSDAKIIGRIMKEAR